MHGMNSKVACYPELAIFESIAIVDPEESLQRGEARVTSRPWFYVMLAVVLFAVFGLGFVGIVAAIQRLSAWHVPVVLAGLALLVMFLLRRLTRRAIRRHLREELTDCGVPVCRGCGFDLRGKLERSCPQCQCAVNIGVQQRWCERQHLIDVLDFDSRRIPAAEITEMIDRDEAIDSIRLVHSVLAQTLDDAFDSATFSYKSADNSLRMTMSRAGGGPLALRPFDGTYALELLGFFAEAARIPPGGESGTFRYRYRGAEATAQCSVVSEHEVAVSFGIADSQ